MASIEKQRAIRIRKDAAAKLIQVVWRFYRKVLKMNKMFLEEN